jgi:glycosyltransferase involved in cell wall biosynthesis
MASLTISIVVPIVPRHNIYLNKLITNIENGKIVPECLIIVASSQTKKSKQEIRQVLKRYSSPYKLIFSNDQFPPGQNRNKGWEIADTDYVTFCDADDTYARDRISILKNIAKCKNADLILHNYSRLKPLIYLNNLQRTNKLVASEELYKSTFPLRIRNKDLEKGIAGDTNVILPGNIRNNWKIHHGHATVKRSLEIRYGDRFRGEDGQFCRDVLFSGKNLIYTPNKLSNYDRPTLNNIVLESRNRIHTDLANLKIKVSKFK